MQPRNEKIAALQREVDALNTTLTLVNLKTANGEDPCWKMRKQLADKHLELAQAYEQSLSSTELANHDDVYQNIVREYWQSYFINYNQASADKLNLTCSRAESDAASVDNSSITKAEALFYSGLQYLSGIGKNISFNNAFVCYQKAAELGYAPAQNNLGGMYRNGKGTEQNYKNAFDCYQKAAELGYAPAQNSLGWMYRHGKGTEQDDNKAFVCYQKAAEQGLALAQHNLGGMYRNGKGTEQDDNKAFVCYQKAAEQGLGLAQYSLGWMYLHGEGVQKNPAFMLMWYRKASKSVKESQQSLRDLSTQNQALEDADYQSLLSFINENDITQVAQKIKDWKSTNQFDAVKYEILAYLFGIEDKNIRFNQLLKALCKSTAMGAILYEPVGFTLKSANIAKGRLGEVARALNDLADDNDNTFTIDNDVKTLLQTQISSDKSFVPNLETTYKALHKQLMSAGVIARPAIMQHREVEMTTLTHNRK